MTSPETIFQSNKELSAKLGAVVHADWFGECLIYARAVMLDGTPTTEEMNGAKKFVDALALLAASPESTHPPLSSGIQHDLSIPVRTTFAHSQPTATKP